MDEPGRIIEKIAYNERITVSALATRLGKPAANLYDIQKGKIKSISRKLADTIISVYPYYNRDWLLYGTGNMYSGDVPVPAKSPKQGAGIPLYDVDFGLGYIDFYNDCEIRPITYVNFPGTDNATCWCKTTGDSMEPMIHSGDYVCLQKIQQWDVYLTMGEVYAIEAVNDMRTIKRLEESEDKDCFRLVPVNQSEYKPQNIRKDAIRQIFKVIAVTKFL